MEEITKARRKAIAESIRTISAEELKALGEKLFPGVDHSWREKFFAFINENPGARPDAAEGAGDCEADRRRALSRALNQRDSP